MSADPPGDEVGGEALAELFSAVEEGDRLTLTFLPPDGVAETRVVESVSDAEKTPLDRDEPA